MDENTGQGLTRIDDVVYGEVAGLLLRLDIMHPDPLPATTMPVVVHIHGGGWMEGSKDDFNPNEPLARAGFFTISIDYRLSPRAAFPAQIHDAKMAIRWVRANAARYHLDPDRIGVWGHSAGGHLAALLGTSWDVPELEGTQVDVTGGLSSRVYAVMALSGLYDFLRSHCPGSDDWPAFQTTVLTSLFGGPVAAHATAARLANPRTHLRPGVPPFLLVHGDQDEIVPVGQAEYLYQALREVGCAVTFLRQATVGHDLGVGGLGWDTIRALAVAFFTTHLRASQEQEGGAGGAARASKLSTGMRQNSESGVVESEAVGYPSSFIGER